ncbi:F0F1 ATP synthase subunit B family protein [Caloramator sp. Dgby_cultured_2]|uniref:F0F1 ATP synthase subunit B family protein n=1 Tax=Caloramator sp. Dgby_cultured_2 TaxID=3029174 RepID=UPI00237D6922|nr:hypothetical protein [Caloramator sp. Dgby_cultured_2]WDU82580.1 hypothetical protein PWK10_13445 [Caloramator sp. Dgby_cultured_2]
MDSIFYYFKYLHIIYYFKEILFDRFNNIMEARRLSIENKIKEANENYDKSTKLLKEYEEKLKSLEIEGKK